MSAGRRPQKRAGTRRRPELASAPAGAAGRRDQRAVSSLQRLRLLDAMAAICREQGTAPASVSAVCLRARTSRRTFYEMFEGSEDCFLATLQEAIDRALARVLPAWQGQERWLDAVRAALRAFLRYLDEDPLFGRLFVVDALAAGPAAIRWRAQALRCAVQALDSRRTGGRAPAHVTPLSAEATVGAVLSLLHARLTEAPGGPLSPLLGGLMSVVVLPYLGPAAARRELAQTPPSPPSPRHAAGDPLAPLGMRLTYRTIRVLEALAEQGGRGIEPSNREISIAAGINDAGQASKLLARLAHHGVAQNNGGGPRGAPNAWRLTERGAAIAAAVGRRGR